MSLLDVFIRGGVIMYPIMLCMIVMAYVAIDRWIAVRKARVDVSQFMMKVRSIFQRGEIDAVIAFCPQGGAPIANIIRRGALKHRLGIERARDAMEDATREEAYHLAKRLTILESVARVAPMLGLLGALAGIAGPFLRIESAGGTGSQGDVAHGVSAALIGGWFGLAVGIPAYVFYKYLKTRVARTIHEMDLVRTEFLDLLEQASVLEKPLPVQVEASPASFLAKPATTLVFDDDLYFRRKR